MANSGKINLYKLKYRIVYCSGEDPEYPVTELLDNSPQSRGWQSPKFCEYPQEIIIQFTNIVRLKQIQFLSHQSKISQKIELHTYVPTGTQALSTQIPLNMIKFTKLGYLSLDSNERSQFQARELKSVYVDSVTLLLKLVFHKCFVNKYNLYNQVGLIAVNCMGEMHGAVMHGSPGSNAQNRLSLVNQSMQGPVTNIEEELSLDKNTLETLKALYAAKERAVQMDDFDEAKRIRDTIERLKTVSTQISQLEERKLLAIKSEDYDAAKIIKVEIEKLKSAVMYPHFQAPQFPPQYYGQGAPVTGNTNFTSFGLGNMMGGTDTLQNMALPMGMQQQQLPPLNNANPYGRGNFDQYEEKKGDEIGFDGSQEFGRNHHMNASGFHHDEEIKIQDLQLSKQDAGRQSLLPDIKEVPIRPSVAYDDQVIPTLSKGPGKKGGLDEGNGEGGQEGEEGKVEEISPENMKYAEALIPIFGDATVKKMFSRPWALRDEGLKECEEHIKKNNSESPVFQAALSAAGQAMGDKIAQIIQRGMSLLQTTLKCCNTQMDPGNSSAMVFNQLFVRLGDNNARVREKAEELLLMMAGHKSFGAQTVCSQIMKGQVKKSAAFSIKHIQGRLQLLHKVLEKYPVNKHNINYQQCLEYAIHGFQHQSGEIRNQAYHVILEIYRSIGANIRKSLTGLRPAQLELLETGFAEIDGVDPATLKIKGSPQRESIQGNPKTAALSKPTSQQKKSRLAGKDDLTKKCQFCGKNDSAFAQSENIDMHYWRECIMLTECTFCSQVIEISTYNQHLLNECDKAKDFKQCGRCKESVNVAEYEQHVADKSCLINKPLKAANRCPLCHQDIKPGESGWKKHLTDEGCPKNPRKK
ncbi:centrosomal protein of 104 kda [Stylonychia lemnae]|uniref:Centrosomal protein of 104 kDa n=1 Tax=Stylonychia lemnae TaxID=5949 RepID=A0A078B3K7_STYLE|nr:centrosomal protein of 104 kda [Stylonychia lemnae]|eukprot:CDW88088.1 centrosomal protein of 104 kda [Stylonychia lemnae]